MKRYFVCSDIHGFYDEFISALKEKGFDESNSSHYLIICGDLFDRGPQAVELYHFVKNLYELDRLIYIRGNHEDLLFDCVNEMQKSLLPSMHHFSNRTVDTVCQFMNSDSEFDLNELLDFINKASIPYYELGDYIFVHGWIPHIRDYNELKGVKEEEWKKDAWSNGMLEWKNGWVLPGKTIVCGHWHTSFGNYHYHGEGSSEFEKDSCFEPFIDKGIIALDGCTAFTHKVNVITIDIGE